MSRDRSLVIGMMGLFLAACDGGAPEYVFVRTNSVVVTVTAQSDSRVRAGEWLRLRASRATTGQWQKLRLADVPKDVPWVAQIPPGHEPDVAASLRWFAEPMDGVEFDNPVARAVPPVERGVRFGRPGTYRLWATSYAPQDGKSNTLEVEVTARE
jgi:hypothetical protein